jgi:ribosomal protein S18 acetylase RimI-like enzyme
MLTDEGDRSRLDPGATATLSVRRRPFRSESVPEAAAFAARHPVDFVDAATFERVMSGLLDGPPGVIDLFAGEQRVALACLFDRVELLPDHVVAVLVAAGGLAEWTAPVRIIFDAAEEAARSRRRSGVALTWFEPLPSSVAQALEARGQRLLFREYGMERPAAVAAPRTALPAGWSWRPVDESLLEPSMRLLGAAFAGAPMFRPSSNQFATMLVAGNSQARLLLDGQGRPAAFVRVIHDPAQGVGYIGPIGRHPYYRGHRVGDLIMEQCLDLLGGTPLVSVKLDVWAGNLPAVELYQRYGFQIRRQRGTYHGPLAGAAPTR